MEYEILKPAIRKQNCGMYYVRQGCDQWIFWKYMSYTEALVALFQADVEYTVHLEWLGLA